MDRTTATADAMTVAAEHQRAMGRTRRSPATQHPGRTTHPGAAARRIPRDYRISHVFRTLGRGLVAEYDPA